MKKQIPFAIREIVDKTLSDNPNLIKATFKENSVVVFKEKYDDDSNFFFTIESINSLKGGETTYTISFMPCNFNNFSSKRHTTILNAVEKDFQTWVKILNEYNKESIIFDDTITQKYFENLESDIKILDDDAETAPFKPEQQEHINVILNNSIKLIEANKDEENRNIADEIIKDIESTKKTLSKSTKNEVIVKIKKIIAKSYKFNLEVGKAILVEFTKESIIFIGKVIIQSLS
ncbi:MAG: hypothetical protein KA270_05380 [Saprospiraceae bacterium]|nr:hypothetical protein [Saprospiraceae bacterium]MBP6566579.1 hypothetical protein [Saprospiraceae bacterium]